jgi:MFS family permease
LKQVLLLLREEPRARLFFVALTQSALGTGAAYVALLLIAYDRFESPWAISLVLVADLLPAMLLGPVFGAAADRWSRRWCAVGSDVIRAAAFVGIVVVDGFVPTILLAALAGAGTALFTPATLAGLPSLVDPRRVPAATSLYGAVADLGFTIGPALAAGILALGGPEEILVINGVTFALSAVILARLPFGAPALEAEARGSLVPSLLRDAREGLAVVAGMRGVRLVIAGSTAALFFGGVFNVGELLFATDELDSGDVGYSVVVALFGLGFIFGSLAGSAGGSPQHLRTRFLQGIALMGLGFLLTGLAPTLPVALLTFALAGFGNGLLLVHERVIVQETVPDRWMGRAFGVKDALASWAFGGAFFAAGGLLTVVDVRPLIVATGAGGILVAALCAFGLRREGLPATDARWAAALGGGGGAVARGDGREDGADLVRGRDPQRTLLDNPDQG